MSRLHQEPFVDADGLRFLTEFELSLFQYAEKTRLEVHNVWQSRTLARFFNIYGIGEQTPARIKVASGFVAFDELLRQPFEFEMADGDGSVSSASASEDRFDDAILRVGIKATHTSLLESPRVFSYLKNIFDVGCPWEGSWTTPLGT